MNSVKYIKYCRDLNFLKYNTNIKTHYKPFFCNYRLLCSYRSNIKYEPTISRKSHKNTIAAHFRLYSTNSLKLKEESQPSEAESDDVIVRDPSAHPLLYFNTYDLKFDPVQAAAYSNEILDDPISYITVEQSSKFLLPFPNPDPPTIFEVLTKPFGDGHLYEPASTMVHLCVERLENEELTKAFDIDEGFNKRAYFLTLHIWLIYRRVEREIPEGVIVNRYLLKIFYRLLKDWLGIRKVPEYRFRNEFENTQNHMVKLISELQKCTEDGELYPYKLSVCLKKVMYDDEVSDEVVDLLVKYTIRQFMHLHNIDTNHIMNAMFLWGDTEEICRPPRLLKRPMLQLIKYGGYRGSKLEQIEGSDTKKLK